MVIARRWTCIHKRSWFLGRLWLNFSFNWITTSTEKVKFGSLFPEEGGEKEKSTFIYYI